MVRQIRPRELSTWIAEGKPVLLVDVREPWENALCRLPGSVLLPLGELAGRASELDPPAGALVVAYCHHGVRSLRGAALLAAQGIDDVASLAGGIDAWSLEIDPTVPRY
jgi:rhodanese-related sulfurtransferase